ncbi:MAG: hypothetical protein M4579_005805, partial [Chaenotheca gracillima]
MADLHNLLSLVVRDDASGDDATPACDGGDDYDGRLGLRISAVFVILVGSTLGVLFPVFVHQHQGIRVPKWTFFVAKYFGSGVIIATAFIHLLAPANEALTDPCLTGPITEYDWVEGIALMTIFVLFFIELMALRYATFSNPELDEEQRQREVEVAESSSGPSSEDKTAPLTSPSHGHSHGHRPGEDHLGHTREHSTPSYESYSAQVTAIFILEFGVIFHSIFIGLTLAVAGGSEFITLYIVLVFHQTFEGLGLGSRLAVTPWPKSKRWTPYILGLAYGITTPLSIGIGIAVKAKLGYKTGLMVNGVFDSISAGILIYTGLVELMAHEFMFSDNMRTAELKVVLSAFGM